MKRMSSTRFHKAAKDGSIDILKEANRKDANAKDNDSMTPVLWAAFEGHLDALRLLCGRGGDPDKSDQFGNTALHLAAAKGHLYCVDFLVKFGVNIYALDIDKHSAKDLAAINNRDEILRFLDVAITNFEACNRKKAKTMKELAEKQCEKRMREFLKRQKLMEHDELTQKQVVADRDTLRSNTSRSTTSSMLSTLKQKIWSSQGNLNKSTIGSSSKFSDSSASENSCKSLSVSFMASGNECTSMSSRRRTRNINEECLYNNVNINTVTEYRTNGAFYDTNGARSYKKDEQSRPRIRRNKSCIRGTSSEESSDMYSTLTRSRSQAYLLAETSSSVDMNGNGTEYLGNVLRPRPLFGEGALNSLSSRRSVAAALNQLAESTSHTNSSKSSTTINKNFDYTKCSENKLSKHFGALSISEDDLAGADLNDEDRIFIKRGSLELFLMLWGLEEFLSIFIQQQIDLEILMLLTEDDLKSLALPLGPFRKLHFAIQERKNILAKPGPLIDSEL